MVFVVGLLALGALEFGLLGASAAGIVGGSGHPLPPISQRNVEVATATPPETPVATATSSGGGIRPIALELVASIELMQPDPAAIVCDGIHSSSLRVFVRDPFGNAVFDGTPVYFSVINGSATPYFALTNGGRASTSAVIYSDAYSQTPNVEVRAGGMETAIRVRCLPNSGGPLSPPPFECNPSPGIGNVNSPPCATPLPCNPSPGADVNSPPCAVKTPISPPVCAPNQTSPPCTPLSPPPCDPKRVSAPCPTATPTPFPCNPNVPSTPPCAPPPPPTNGIGGRIFIGTPELINGKLRVPVNTTASQDPYFGFNAHLVWDGALAGAASPIAETTTSSVFGSAPLFCTPAADPVSKSAVFACVTLDNSQTSAAGNLTSFWLQPSALQPSAQNGCLHLHLFTYGRADAGDPSTGTFAVNAGNVAAQANTYGPDVYVNIADGTPCSPGGISSCIDFNDPSRCPSVTSTAQPTPPPATTSGLGGELYIGTPELVGGQIRVPVNTTHAQDAFVGFNAHLQFDTSLVSLLNSQTDSVAGAVFDPAAGFDMFCVRYAPEATGRVLGCTNVGPAPNGTHGPGTLGTFSFTPNAATGCLALHLVRFGEPNGLGATDASYTIDWAQSSIQTNTYGPDVYVNIADGTPCGLAGCIDFNDPSLCNASATPTPPGPDAQTATAVASPPQATATATPTAVPTATQPPAPSPTPVPATPTTVPTATQTATSTATASPTPTQPCADVTGDGRVTGRDVVAIAAHIIGRYNAKYDLNYDGRVNIEDVRIAIRELGRHC